MSAKVKTQDKSNLTDIDENISKSFEIKKRLGKGAYGIVWKAVEKKSKETVAVKKIFDAFRDETDAQRTFREIVFLNAFRSHPNIVKLHNVFRATNNLDIYLVFEYMESDLHNIIKKGNILKDIHKRYVMYQLLNAIKYIHSGNVIHRDLKPSNILIDSKCRCKLADFGLARSVSNRPCPDSDSCIPSEVLLTDYVATRWYRAPEILVASKRYTKGIDMWSLGCILGEMIQGKPLFQGTSTINQIEKIVNILPNITEHDIKAVGADFGSVLLNKKAAKEKQTSFNELLPDAPPDALDLVKSLLLLDPSKRLTAKQALVHPYIGKFRNSIPEIELSGDILPPFRDDVRLSVSEYRSKLYEIVQTSQEKPANSTRMPNTNVRNRGHGDAMRSLAKDKRQQSGVEQSVKGHNVYEKMMPDRSVTYFTSTNSVESSNNSSKNLKMRRGKNLPKPNSSNGAGNNGCLPTVIPSIEAINRTNSTLDESSLNIRNGNRNISYSHHHILQQQQHGDHVLNNINMKSRANQGGAMNGHVVTKQISNGKAAVLSNTVETVMEGHRRLYRSSSTMHKAEKCFNVQAPHEKDARHRLKRSVHTLSPTTGVHEQHHVEITATKPVSEVRNTKSERHTQLQYIPPNRQNVNRPSNATMRSNSGFKVAGSGGGGPIKGGSHEHICYERHLQKLDAEIQRYTKEVKNFFQEKMHHTNCVNPALRYNGSGQSMANSLLQASILDEERLLQRQHLHQQQMQLQLKQQQLYMQQQQQLNEQKLQTLKGTQNYISKTNHGHQPHAYLKLVKKESCYNPANRNLHRQNALQQQPQPQPQSLQQLNDGYSPSSQHPPSNHRWQSHLAPKLLKRGNEKMQEHSSETIRWYTSSSNSCKTKEKYQATQPIRIQKTHQSIEQEHRPLARSILSKCA